MCEHVEDSEYSKQLEKQFLGTRGIMDVRAVVGEGLEMLNPPQLCCCSTPSWLPDKKVKYLLASSTNKSLWPGTCCQRLVQAWVKVPQPQRPFLYLRKTLKNVTSISQNPVIAKHTISTSLAWYHLQLHNLQIF